MWNSLDQIEHFIIKYKIRQVWLIFHFNEQSVPYCFNDEQKSEKKSETIFPPFFLILVQTHGLRRKGIKA